MIAIMVVIIAMVLVATMVSCVELVHAFLTNHLHRFHSSFAFLVQGPFALLMASLWELLAVGIRP